MKSDKYMNNSQGQEYDVRSCLKCKDMQLFQFIDNKWICLNCLEKKLNKKRRKGER